MVTRITNPVFETNEVNSWKEKTKNKFVVIRRLQLDVFRAVNLNNWCRKGDKNVFNYCCYCTEFSENNPTLLSK